MEPKHLLVIRNSAMGDVAMTVPVLQQLLRQYPALTITVLTQSFLQPLFEPLERVDVYAFDTKGRHRGIRGIYRLFRELKKKYSFVAVADLHDVLRSQLLRRLFRVTGTPTARIDKGRSEKKRLTAKENKQLQPLKSSFQRYADVFAKLGLPVTLDTSQPTFQRQEWPVMTRPLLNQHKKNILIVPFARHAEKMYPAEKMKAVAQRLADDSELQVFWLGGGKEEIAQLQHWEKEIPGTISVAGKFSLREELALLSNMDVVVSMDSANMHLASLFGVPVISVWGATHPFAGFYGWGQRPENAAQQDLYCRPCSVFGNKPCYRGDHACLEQLPGELIFDKIKRVLGEEG